MREVKVGDVLRAEVFATGHFGIYLWYRNREIFVHSASVEWSKTISPEDYASIGEELEVTILEIIDEDHILGWLPPKGS